MVFIIFTCANEINITNGINLYRKNMSGTEYENYGRQYQTFQKIVAVYDTEPDNFPR